MLKGVHKAVIGMIHVSSLPGAPYNVLKPDEIIRKALFEAKILTDNGIDGIAIENMHDVPYIKGNNGPQVVGIMSIIGYEIKKEFKIPCGIQILAGANKEALAAAHSAGLDFIRAEGFVFGHIADEGYIDSDAGELLRYRSTIKANKVKIFTDIKKKHSSHLITADVDIVETAKAAEFFCSDGIIITGTSTGIEPSIFDVQKVKTAVKIPVIIGSGITLENIEKYFEYADGFIVGSYFKEDGYWKNDISTEKVKNFMKRICKLRA